MNLDEVPPVIDVHPPHEPIHGWRDFFLHLATITIGLLIALSLEGLVEWQHHRHLVHEAEASLYTEIKSNESRLASVLDDVRKQQATLKQDVVILDQLIKDPKSNTHQQMSIAFRIVGFDNVSWKTAQNTGALAYMPYDRAQEYAGIYSLQDELDVAQKQGARDTILSVGSFLNADVTDPAAATAQNERRKQQIEVVQGQLLLVDSLVTGLDAEYKKFLAAHPEGR
jgi:hypothetical protein